MSGKILNLIFSFILLISLSLKKELYSGETKKITVLSTVSMIHDIVTNIGGNFIEADLLITSTLDPHSYELVKGDFEKLKKAEIIFYNGLGLEHGWSLKKQLENNPRAFALAEISLKETKNLILKKEGQVDPHIWLDASIWLKIVDPIVEILSQKAPMHKEFFISSGEKVKRKLQDLDCWAKQVLGSIPREKRFLVTSHDSFSYFVRRYLCLSDWENRISSPEGLSPDGEIGLADIKRVINFIEKNKITVLFHEFNLNKNSLTRIVSILKKKYSLKLSKNYLYSDSFRENTSYFSMFEHNVNTLYEELNDNG